MKCNQILWKLRFAHLIAVSFRILLVYLNSRLLYQIKCSAETKKLIYIGDLAMQLMRQLFLTEQTLPAEQS